MGLHRPVPPPLRSGAVGLRVIRRSDAGMLERLLTENRGWLRPWEATHPSGLAAEPGSVSMVPTIRVLRKHLRAGTGLPWVITYDNAVVGQLSASEVSGGALCSGQVGYWIAQDAAGRGIVTTAVALAIDWLFDHWGLHRVEICIRPENQPSLRIVEKLGLRYEGRRLGYIHIAGDWRDHDCFAVTREERRFSMLDRLERRAEPG